MARNIKYPKGGTGQPGEGSKRPKGTTQRYAMPTLKPKKLGGGKKDPGLYGGKQKEQD